VWRSQLASDQYELRVIDADGTERIETFSNADDLAKRQTQLQQAMSNERWTGPHGWVM
jgi:hypothetical protein